MTEEKKREIEERYEHLLKTRGEESTYVQGFRECMRLVGVEAEKPTWKKKMLNTFLGGGRE